ncbi:hypothetical protein H310_02741 [Aphanomyces invadans]|uniref:UBR-type domain-containing protein n=1 Tax=Aphanomyces invadans TaxID=157072 RepID=A0A024UKY0_9STRA|nr:hypothetical protein H310_02741 [Aphanomyces invadans]ETW06502.1 hypothetical protein H310_02741 [Aphanomyces invadans]|eukprot:XP_008864577.1 hypothetical protein H310_02741 [Aphanomyces invadans]
MAMAATGDNEEVEVTLQEVLEQDTELVHTANAVLGDASATHCSFPDGYVRQALFACLTCKTDEPAGLCLACSLTCHTDHELVELYTKRHFRCDCGNSKFNQDAPCKLYEGKDPLNKENAYSQNFHGRYCSCHRPYPDPDRTTPEIMIQCIVCEDWFHEEHLFEDSATNAAVLDTDFDEMVCRSCMASHAFLYNYAVSGASSAPTDQAASGVCRMTATVSPPSPATPTFWTQGWRGTLCQCDTCVELYESLGCRFLLDESDSLLAYEAKAATTSTDDASVKAFQTGLSHEQQVEMAIGYDHMATSLKEYLAGFAASGQTVKAEDIQEFFQTLRASKRQKRDK